MSARIAWLLPVGMTAAVYWSLIRNYFFGDDFSNLWTLINNGVGRFLLAMNGGHMLVVRNFVFALSYGLFGMHAAAYFWVVLGIHLLNVYLLFVVARGLVGGWRLAAVIAALWGM